MCNVNNVILLSGVRIQINLSIASMSQNEYMGAQTRLIQLQRYNAAFIISSMRPMKQLRIFDLLVCENSVLFAAGEIKVSATKSGCLLFSMCSGNKSKCPKCSCDARKIFAHFSKRQTSWTARRNCYLIFTIFFLFIYLLLLSMHF